MANILVLGGYGFIGKNVVKRLKSHHQLTVTSQSPIKSAEQNVISLQTKYDFDSFRKILSTTQFAAVLFLSGNSHPANSEHSPIYELDTTYTPFLALLEAIRLFSKETTVWYASSVAVYGANSTIPLRENSETKPLSFYGITKLQMEEYLRYYTRVHGLSSGIFRIFSTYGPGLKRQLVYDIVKKMIENKNRISLFGDGSESRDLSFVEDQANAISFLIEKTKPVGDIYNIGSGRVHSVGEVAEKIANILDIKPEIIFTPRRSFDGTIWQADVSRIESLGFRQQFSFEEGLKQTVGQIISGSNC